MIHASFASFFGLGLEDGYVPTFCSLLYVVVSKKGGASAVP